MRKKTKEEKEMQGTFEPSKEPETNDLVVSNYEIIPKAPKNWPPDAVRVWRHACLALKDAGYLAKVFIPGLRRYCFAVYQAQMAEKMLMADGGQGFMSTEYGSEGQSYEVINKWLTVLDSANRTIERMGAKFGFSPLDALKIPKIKKVEVKEESLLM